MAITNEDLERVRQQLELKINSVNVEHMHLVQAVGSYGERFTAVDRRLEGIDFRLDALSADMDRRFDGLSADMDRRFEDVRADIARLDGRIDRLESRMETRIDRLDTKLDARFNVQTVLMTVLGVLILFGDPVRELLGL